MSQKEFDNLGCELIGQKLGNKTTKKRRFLAFFGAIPEHIAILWWKLSESEWFDHAPAQKVKHVHLLMGLKLLRTYNVEEVNAQFFKCDEKTFRQWSIYMLEGIAKLDRVIVSLCVV